MIAFACGAQSVGEKNGVGKDSPNNYIVDMLLAVAAGSAGTGIAAKHSIVQATLSGFEDISWKVWPT